LAGAIVTWLVGWRYYKRAGDELKAEAAHLQRTSELILRWLELRGERISVIRDDAGRPTGLNHRLDLVDSLSGAGRPLGGELHTVTDDEAK
jgi:hypothetical protein